MGDEVTTEPVEEPTEVPTPADALPADAWQDEDWEKFLGEYYSGTSAGDSEAGTEEAEPTSGPSTPDEADDSVEPEPATATTQAPAPGAPETEYIEIGSQRIPAEHAERVAAFWEWMNTYPQQAMEFMGYLNGEYTLTPAQEAALAEAAGEAAAKVEAKPSRAEDEDWTFVPESVKEAVGELDGVKQKLETYDKWVQSLEYQQQQAAMEQAAQSVNMGIEQFRTDYDVSDEDLQVLRQEAASLGVADRLAQQYGDPARAVKESLEIAYLRNPAFRDRESARQQEAVRKDRERQSKLGSLGGSGSAPVAKSGPSTPEDRRTAMVRAIREAVNNG